MPVAFFHWRNLLWWRRRRLYDDAASGEADRPAAGAATAVQKGLSPRDEEWAHALCQDPAKEARAP
jgi:hypothetical protein